MSRVSRTRKLHIPITAGDDEDRFLRPGPPDGEDRGGAFSLTSLPLTA